MEGWDRHGVLQLWKVTEQLYHGNYMIGIVWENMGNNFTNEGL